MGTKHKTIWGAEVKLKDGDKALGLIDSRKGKANYEQVFKPAVQKLLHGVGDFLKKTQETGRTGEPKFKNLGRPPGDWMIPPKNQPVWDPEKSDAIPDNRKSPMNHCDSEMMHSGGWGQVRKYNSPGTSGNKEAIKHNNNIMNKIGTFNMPHSPLSAGHEVKKDSLGKDEAWAKWEKGYMDRTHKFKGTKYEKPITAEDNRKEMEMERSEFMYDPKIGQIRLKKTDDAENPIERKSRCWEGYEPTPGVKAYEPGSCRKK